MTASRVLPHPAGRLAIRTHDPVIAARLDERLGPLFVDEPADATLDLVGADLPGAAWDDALAGRLDGDRLFFDLSGGRGSFDLALGEGRLEVATRVAWFELYFENALRMLLVELAGRRGLQVCHAAAVTDGGRAVLLFGPSGAGKTTATELATSRGLAPINDDLVFLEIENETVFVRGCPFHGRTHIRRFAPGRFPLAAMFRLAQADENRAEPLAAAEAVRELAAALVAWRPRTRGEQETVLDFAAGVCRIAPLFRLRFRKEPAFWETVDDVLQRVRDGAGRERAAAL